MSCPEPQGRFPRVTHPSATFHQSKLRLLVRLACVRPAASVRSEPGSNSQIDPAENNPPMPPDTPPKHPGMPKHPETSPQNTKKHRKTAPALKTRTIAPISSNAQASIEDAKTMIPPKAEPPPASPFPHHNVKEQKCRTTRRRRGVSEGTPSAAARAGYRSARGPCQTFFSQNFHVLRWTRTRTRTLFQINCLLLVQEKPDKHRRRGFTGQVAWPNAALRDSAPGATLRAARHDGARAVPHPDRNGPGHPCMHRSHRRQGAGEARERAPDPQVRTMPPHGAHGRRRPRPVLLSPPGAPSPSPQVLDDLLDHLLGVPEEHHRVVAVEELVVDAGIAGRERTLDEEHRLRLLHIEHRHAVDR